MKIEEREVVYMMEGEANIIDTESVIVLGENRYIGLNSGFGLDVFECATDAEGRLLYNEGETLAVFQIERGDPGRLTLEDALNMNFVDLVSLVSEGIQLAK